MLFPSLLFALALPGDPVRVARLELPAPTGSPFLIHATLPVPAGSHPLVEGRSTLYVESHDPARTRVPAQIQIVSRAPAGEPDVIEVLARVELGPKELRSGRTEFWVLQADPAPPAPFHALPQVDELLGRNSRNLLLRTTDVHGNVYVADLCGDARASGFGSLRLAKDGAHERELRLATTFVPLPTPTADGEPLPHLMGVHAFVRERAGERVVGLDLRIHNGCSSGSQPASTLEQPLGAVYWRSLELLVPREWVALPSIEDPFLGQTREEGRYRVLELVAPLPEGKLHLMPPQSQFVRRLALAPSDSPELARAELDHAGLAFADPGQGLWSWFEPRCARWLSQRAALPLLEGYSRGSERGASALRSMERARADEYAAALATGKPRGWNTTASAMGWAHPWFHFTRSNLLADATALCEGATTAYSASLDGYRRLEYLHRMSVCRQSEAAWTRSGDPALGESMPGFALPCEGGPVPNAQVLEVARRGLRPPYDLGDWFEPRGSWTSRVDSLLAWWPRDERHLQVYTKNSQALVWLGNDSLAKDDLLLGAELFRLALQAETDPGGSAVQRVSLRELERLAAEHPHQGARVGREFAFGLDAACAGYSTASPAWRAGQREWFERVARALLGVAMPSGILQRSSGSMLLGDDRYALAQSSDVEFLIHALHALDRSVLRGQDDELCGRIDELALRATDYLFWGPPFQPLARARSGPSILGPRLAFAVANDDDYATPPFCDRARWGEAYLPPDGTGGGLELTHGWWVLEWASELSEPQAGVGLENKYLKRALEYGLPHSDYASLARELLEQLRDAAREGTTNSLPLYARLQSLGVK
ncbi:MAG: hypothetical protein IPJ19_12895 [Planctomycetes bacterium]|nr:hypothetical protein [Planctomycetota bacterium]